MPLNFTGNAQQVSGACAQPGYYSAAPGHLPGKRVSAPDQTCPAVPCGAAADVELLHLPPASNAAPQDPAVPAQPPDGAATPADAPDRAPMGAEGFLGMTPQEMDELLPRAAKICQDWEMCMKAYNEPWLEPVRQKVHWDFLLEETAWLANDFGQVRELEKAPNDFLFRRLGSGWLGGEHNGTHTLGRGNTAASLGV